MTATTTFLPPRAPFTGPAKTVSYKTKTATFGENYVQRGQDGIRNILRSYPIQWTKLDPADADTIETFMNTQGGWKAFNYQVPGDSAVRQWLNGPVTRNDYGPYSTLSVTLTEAPDT